MKDVNGNKKVRKRITLKEYFNGLKTHQKILLVTSHLIGFAQFLIAIYLYYLNIQKAIHCDTLYPNYYQNSFDAFMQLSLNYWYCTILPPVVMTLDLALLKMKKFSYIVCILNVVIIFFNKLLAFAFAWHWA